MWSVCGMAFRVIHGVNYASIKSKKRANAYRRGKVVRKLPEVLF